MLLFTALHFAVSLGCLFVALMGSNIDEESSGPISRAGELLFLVLAQPGVAIWNRYGDGLSDAVEWSLVAANSLLWGFALSWCYGRFIKRDSAQPTQTVHQSSAQ